MKGGEKGVVHVAPAMDQAAYGSAIVPMESVGQSKFIGKYCIAPLKLCLYLLFYSFLVCNSV